MNMYFKLRKQYGGFKTLFLRAYFSYLVQLPLINKIYAYFYKKHVKEAIKSKYPLTPKSVNVETYNICNGNCVMCPYNQMTRPKEIMSMKLFRKIVDDLKENGVEAIAPSFYSEPFLDPLIFERIKYVKDKGMRVKIFTNASMLDKDRINKLLDCPPDIIINSIDAVRPETYKKIRTGLDFDKVKNNIQNLVAERNRRNLKKPRIKTVFVLQNYNINEVEEYKKEWQKIVDKVDVNIDNMLVKGIPRYFRKPFPCKKLFDMFVVLSSGKVALCCNDFDGRYILGDFNKQNFREIYFGQVAENYRNLHQNFQSDKMDICRQCIYSYDIYSYKWWRV